VSILALIIIFERAQIGSALYLIPVFVGPVVGIFVSINYVKELRKIRNRQSRVKDISAYWKVIFSYIGLALIFSVSFAGAAKYSAGTANQCVRLTEIATNPSEGAGILFHSIIAAASSSPKYCDTIPNDFFPSFVVFSHIVLFWGLVTILVVYFRQVIDSGDSSPPTQVITPKINPPTKLVDQS